VDLSPTDIAVPQHESDPLGRREFSGGCHCWFFASNGRFEPGRPGLGPKLSQNMQL
jgi:hypothetical protein